MTADKPYQVHILWGTTHELDARPETYEFSTQGELEAFLSGVDEAHGWMNYEVIDDLANWKPEWMNPARVQVEYDLAYWGGNYSDVGTIVMLSVNLPDNGDEEPTVRAAFQKQHQIDPVHIVSYNVLEDGEPDPDPNDDLDDQPHDDEGPEPKVWEPEDDGLDRPEPDKFTGNRDRHGDGRGYASALEGSDI